MYCSGCGQLLGPNEAVCRRCGKPLVAAPVAPVPARTYLRGYDFRVQRNLHTLGVLWIVYACWSVLQVIVAATVLSSMTGMFGDGWGMNRGIFWERFPFYNAAWLVPLIVTATIVRTILSIATGLSLLRRAPWGRTLAIVAAILTLIKPVLGTILAIYTLWVMAPRSSGQEYERISVP